jgi:hypothetical protein
MRDKGGQNMRKGGQNMRDKGGQNMRNKKKKYYTIFFRYKKTV